MRRVPRRAALAADHRVALANGTLERFAWAGRRCGADVHHRTRQPSNRPSSMMVLLQRVTQVRRGELAAVVASSLSFFFILSALMVVRPAREALGMQRG